VQAAQAFGVLGHAAKNAIPKLTQLANDPTLDSVPFIAAMTLAKLGDDGFPPLFNLLTNETYAELRYRGVIGMRYQGTNAIPAIPWLLNWLNDPGTLISSAAAETLGWLAVQPDVVLPGLSNRLKHPEQHIRFETVGVLEIFAMKDRAAVPTLAVALGDSDASVREAATNALLKIAPEALTNASRQ
jgi:HEAT repeat protein